MRFSFLKSASTSPWLAAPASLALVLLTLGNPALAASKSLPDLPTYLVFDEPQALKLPLMQAEQRVVGEHVRVTGEPIFVAVMKDTGDESIEDYSKKLFSKWRTQFQGQTQLILMALDTTHHKARVMVSFDLEAQFPSSRTDAIVNDFIKPELTAGNADRAVVLGTLEILRTLDSPMIENGEAQKIYSAGGFRGDWQPVQLEAQRSFGIWLLFGAFFSLALIHQILAAEAHYTSRGWIRIPPWKINFKKKQKLGQGIMTGGGASGRW
ncbi:MAG: TPM domain-containing protein [Methylotenera sp.]|nr:TPM domain-containing protein [Oligoflexia bacterium]